jgi:hypothetical protein
MVSINLTQTWITRVDTGEHVSGMTKPGSVPSYATEGETRTFASGRQRSIARMGERGEWPIEFSEMTTAQRDTLRAWKGVTVFVRNYRGDGMFGVYYATDPKPVDNYPDLYDVALTVRMVTEEV